MTDVKQLAKVLRSFDLSRLEYENEGLRIVLERNVSVVMQPLSNSDTPSVKVSTDTSAVEKDMML